MGLSSSTLASNDNVDHFSEIVNPKKPIPSNTEDSEVESFNMGLSRSSKVHLNKNVRKVRLDARAGILKKMDSTKLWNNFLKGCYMSFALTQSEASSLMKQSLIDEWIVSTNEGSTNMEISSYIELVEELSEKDFGKNSKVVDFMALCSSSLLLTDFSIEFKIESLYKWITMSQNAPNFDFKL